MDRFGLWLALALAQIGILPWPAAADPSTLSLVQSLVATEDAGQCYGGAHGVIITPAGTFSSPMFLDTDGRRGGCNYQIGIIDAQGELARHGFKLVMAFSANADAGQCGNIGTQEVPVSQSLDHIRFTKPIFIDTDDRPGGCLLRWTLSGTDVFLDVKFWSNLDAGQCGHQGNHSIGGGQYVEIFLDMDNRPGGCFLSLRLRAGSSSPDIVRTDGHPAGGDAGKAAPQPAIAPAPIKPLEKRVALVIGNGDYRSAPKLVNPPNDAADIVQALRKLKFEVIEGRNLDHAGMDGAVRQFGRALDGADLALFYYAGHGLQVDGKNYLVPVDAKLERPADLALDAVDIDVVLAQMEAAKRVNLIFLDACRDNPFARSLARSLGARSTSVGQGLAAIQSAVGTMITYATQPNNVALDGKGRNSPFTTALLKNIATPGLEIDALLKRVRADVMTLTHDQQVPWNHSSLVGDVVLAR